MSRGKILNSLSLCLLLCLGGQVIAQTATTKLPQSELKKKARPKFGLASTLELSTNLVEGGAYESSQSAVVGFAPSYKLSDKYTLSSQIQMSTELKESSDVSVNDIPINFSYKGTEISKNIKYKPSFALYLPTSENSREVDTLQMALGIKQSLSFSNLFDTGLGLGLGLSVKNSFHTFSRDTNNDANTQLVTVASAGLSYDLTDNLSAGAGFGYIYARKYQGNEAFIYSASQSLNYTISKKLTAYLSHSTEGSALDYDGSSNIDVFDKNASVIGVGITIVQ